MNINSLGNNIYGKTITLLSKNNPFKKGSLQYYLIAFVIREYSSLSKHLNDSNNTRLLKFLASKKEPFYIDAWNGSKLFETAISLSIVHNIIKFSKPFICPSFGIFAEEGLFNLLEEPKFYNQLPKGDKATENVKLLWLSLYMNQKIKKENHVPQISFDRPNFSYSEKSFNISFSNFPYNKIFNSIVEIPLAAFSDAWYSTDWIGLTSRGLFHHVGDHVGFFYGAIAVGHCYFLGRDQSNHLVTLSTPNRNGELENERDSHLPYFNLFSHVHPTDFSYVYGVPKGNPALFDNPMVVSSEEQDCQQNPIKNVTAAEHFWDNPVFMKNNHRKMFVGSIEDKFKDILNNIQDLLSENQNIIVQKIINNETISKEELIINQLTWDTCTEDTRSEILKRSSFFMKSLAHKTVCEIINPIENLELGFFMKHNGSKPPVKSFFIFSLLFLSFKKKQRKISKPLFQMKERFINQFLTQDKDFVNVWSGDEKKGYLFSEIVSMRNEYRMFVINNRVVATSACFRNTVPLNSWQNGRFDPRLVNGHNDQATHFNRERVAKYAKFARNFCHQMQEENPDCHSYVLDVAWCDEKNCVVPIEINSITWSGAYQINMHRVCVATLKQPFYYEKIEHFFTDKSNIWLEMIKNEIISPSMFELCGLDRTLKGNTLPNLQAILNHTLSEVESFINPPVITSIISDEELTISDDDMLAFLNETLDETIHEAKNIDDEDDDLTDPSFDDESKEK